MSVDVADSDPKAQHRVVWGNGNHPLMVDAFLLPIGRRLVEAAGIGSGVRVLDVAAGSTRCSARSWRSPRPCSRTTTRRTSRPTRDRRFAARANAGRQGREAEFVDALDAFCDTWNRGTAERARLEKEYLIAVGTKR